MSLRLDRPFRAAVAAFRAELPGRRERVLFDVLCRAGQICYNLPHDDIRVSRVAGPRDPRRRLGRDFGPEWRRTLGDSTDAWDRDARRLTRRLVAALRREGSGRWRPLRVLLAYAPGALAPDGRAPRRPLLRLAWLTVVRTFEAIFPSALRRLGPIACVDGRRLSALVRESRAGRRRGRRASGQRAGLQGRLLAVDPALVRQAGAALRRRMAPGFQARYLFYTRPGDHFWPHPDDPAYDAQLLLCVDHLLPPRARRGSAFLAYRHDGTVRRYEIPPGSAVIVSPGRVHGREPMRPGEELVMLSIGLKFAPRSDRAAGSRRR